MIWNFERRRGKQYSQSLAESEIVKFAKGAAYGEYSGELPANVNTH